MELASAAQKFEVAPRLLENLCTPDRKISPHFDRNFGIQNALCKIFGTTKVLKYGICFKETACF
jgi:hypothetical protein